jgi:1-acyl-sn-glycerol-3-phosphate acyltransferase
MRATFAVLLLSATPLLAIPLPGRSHVQRGYCRLMLRCLGVRITVSGGPIRNLQGVLVVSGHVSWVDIFAIDSVMPARFVAKSEIRDWPLLGWLAERAGTLFIRRSRRRDTALVNDRATAAMLAGDVFAVFPEGTTTDGTELLPFARGIFGLAQLAGVPVIPVAVRCARELAGEVDAQREDLVLRNRRGEIARDPAEVILQGGSRHGAADYINRVRSATHSGPRGFPPRADAATSPAPAARGCCRARRPMAAERSAVIPTAAPAT